MGFSMLGFIGIMMVVNIGIITLSSFKELLDIRRLKKKKDMYEIRIKELLK